MAFAVFVEAINIRATRRSAPLQLHDPYHEKDPTTPPPGAAPA
jgi:hypothetical protein